MRVELFSNFVGFVLTEYMGDDELGKRKAIEYGEEQYKCIVTHC